MKTTKWQVASAICGVLLGIGLTGCDDNDDMGDGNSANNIYSDNGDGTSAVYDNVGDFITSNWYDASTGFETTLYPNGTYRVSSGGVVWQTGTWSTSGNQITFHPQGDAPATMTFSLSADGNTMTIYDDGEVNVLTR